MKICLTTNQAAAFTHGGILTQVLQTKRELERLGIEVDLFDMWKSFDRSAYDLVHVFAANMATYHFARGLRTHGVPFVISPVFYSRRSSGVVRAVIRFDRMANSVVRGFWTDFGLMAEMCGWAQAILPNTVEEANMFREGLGVDTTRIHVVPNGVEERFASGNGAHFKKVHGVESYILTVTHIGPERKNVRRFLEAVEGMNRDIVVIGPVDQSPEGKRCRELVNRNPRVRLIGAMGHDDEMLESAYAGCEVFVLPSLFETPGIAALEAGSTGARIVVTSRGGTKEYFGDHAEYVDPSSAADIRRGIESALQRPKTDDLKQRIRSEYSWKSVAEKTLAVYRAVLGNQRSR